MNDKSLRILEYTKIIEMLKGYAGSTMGKELCKKLKPSSDLDTILTMQLETKDALSRVYKKGSISFAGVYDITPSLKRLEIGAAISAGELLQIASLLSCANTVKQFSKADDHTENNDSIQYLFEEIVPLTNIYNDITRSIISEEEISDEASSALKSIRRSIKLTNSKIHDQLSSIISSQNSKTMLQENLITMRNGRYCIPIKQEYRSQFPGMIHDQSSTGSTLFIEPMSVVNLNNELKDLAGKEQTEIERILAGLSEQVGFEKESIKENLSILTRLDFIFARALFAKSYEGSEPLYNDHGYINIKLGRHPLLDKRTVVPINITLGGDFSMLLITGPNTGGKTVSLKTVGLFVLMGQSGLHIPAFEGSELAVFDQVFADIGDEQSIEQSLSTFSSHMTNIVSILDKATPNSLVLFDELGGGTDPTEGAALAISILSHLHNSSVRTIATTHYSELKVFALSTDQVENACCEFDINTLKPTYKLLVGIPGKSNAFAISKKIGLPDYIIEQAKSQIDDSSMDFEALLADLEKSKKTIEKEQQLIIQYKQEIEELKINLEQEKQALNDKKSKFIKDAKEEARSIISEAKNIADESIKKYNNWGKTKTASNKEMEKERNLLRGKLSSLNSDLSIKNQTANISNRPEDFHIGDDVHVLSLNLNGTVSTLPNGKGDLYVQMGILRSLVNIKDLELLQINKPKKQVSKRTNIGNLSMTKSANVSAEINVLGKTVDEAIAILDKYLDDAYLSRLHQVTIIHGKGTGALRGGIHTYLKRQKYVKSYRNGAYGEGEAGVTIVEFK